MLRNELCGCARDCESIYGHHIERSAKLGVASKGQNNFLCYFWNIGFAGPPPPLAMSHSQTVRKMNISRSGAPASPPLILMFMLHFRTVRKFDIRNGRGPDLPPPHPYGYVTFSESPRAISGQKVAIGAILGQETSVKQGIFIQKFPARSARQKHYKNQWFLHEKSGISMFLPGNQKVQ